MFRLLTALAVACALLSVPAAAHASVTPQNDAGSGRDAPDGPTPSFTVAPGVAHAGFVEGTGLDSRDWYAFTAPAGAVVEARVQSSIGCLYVRDAAGTELAFSCATAFVQLSPVAVTAPVTGTYYLEYSYIQAHHYWFSFALNAPAPAPLVDEPVLFPSNGGLAPVSAATQSDEHVVVAVVDTGINPYHDFFAAPALTDHPSAWLDGFPASAESVDLSLDESSYFDARETDEATWRGLSRTTYSAGGDSFDAHLYTFPGTRVVGAVSFGEYEPQFEPLPVLDDHGHGTHSAGLAAGANLAGPDGNVLVVMVEVGAGTFDDGVRWAARQPWIDAVTVSLGNRANAPVTTSPTGDRTGVDWAVHEAELAGKPMFIASGNGVSNTGVAPDHCSTYTSPYTGPAWTTRIGAADGGNGNPTWWHCVPVEAIARTDVVSPDFASQDFGTSASGTSAATPNAAGHFAALLLAGRRAGSSASRAATLEYLLHSAAPPPPTVTAGDPSVYPVSLASQGYGLIDQAALDDATTRLLAASGPRPRPETAEWFAYDETVRRSLWGPGSATAGPYVTVPEEPQDDAGSGGDAPDGRADDVTVAPDVRYTGKVTGYLGERYDWYAFEGAAGDYVKAKIEGVYVCMDLVDPQGFVRAYRCDEPLGTGIVGHVLDQSGTWYFQVRSDAPQDYAFGFGLNGPAPVV